MALGEGGNPFLGKSYFFLIGYEDHLVYFFFFYVFAGTTATIVSGAVAERCRFRAYIIYTFALTGFIYPIGEKYIIGYMSCAFASLFRSLSFSSILYKPLTGYGVPMASYTAKPSTLPLEERCIWLVVPQLYQGLGFWGPE